MSMFISVIFQCWQKALYFYIVLCFYIYRCFVSIDCPNTLYPVCISLSSFHSTHLCPSLVLFSRSACSFFHYSLFSTCVWSFFHYSLFTILYSMSSTLAWSFSASLHAGNMFFVYSFCSIQFYFWLHCCSQKTRHCLHIFSSSQIFM